MKFSINVRQWAVLGALSLAGGLMAGCGGGQDYGSFTRSLSGDIGNGYNTSLAGSRASSSNAVIAGSYPRIETSFELPDYNGDPYDYEKSNVEVSLKRPDGSNQPVPAFYDGGHTWRMRYTPQVAGIYAVAGVTLNRQTAHEQKLEKKDWTVSGDSQHGFVRLDRGDPTRFVMTDGSRFFPLGHNQAWTSEKDPDIAVSFAKMHAAGENWSRVWMNHWDGKNLDWAMRNKLGQIDLKVAQHWDHVVDSAEKEQIFFQMVLQHHGQYSTTSDSNWAENPYNVANGGPLKTPHEFFTNPRARELTKRKLYYILARWGYSPAIMAFELFNEVQYTNAAQDKQWDNVVMWHREMSLFLREHDPNRHLITTSSAPDVALNSPIWDTVDYIQIHAYPADVVTGLSQPPVWPNGAKSRKAWFIGEFGPANLSDNAGEGLHGGLWASLMTGASGAAQYWDWSTVTQHDLYSNYAAASGFIAQSALANHGGLSPTTFRVDTTERAPLVIAPGNAWGAAKQTEFVVGEEGNPPGFAQFPGFIQGRSHPDMMPQPLTLHVAFPRAGTITVTVNKVSASGGAVSIGLDGKNLVQKEYPATGKDRDAAGEEAAISAPLPAGAHTITVKGTGPDWVVLKNIAFSGQTSALAARALVGRSFAAFWLYNRIAYSGTASGAVTGKFTLIGPDPGRYRLVWWDTYAGKEISSDEVTLSKSGTEVRTPPVQRDVAGYLTKGTLSVANVQRPAKKRP